jgi:hypothetical protein
MDRVVQAGALARLDPDPADELAAWEADLDLGRIDDPMETRRRLAAYERGEQLIVRLELFADVDATARRGRFDGSHVRGLWFEAGAEDANRAHAREMIANHLEDLHRALVEQHGLELSYADLVAVPIVLELDPELARRAAGHPAYPSAGSSGGSR